MSWSKFAPLGAVCVCALSFASAAQADVLVVRAIGPSAASYKPGTKLPDSAAVALKAGDQLIVLDKGGTRTLRGPGRFSAAATQAGPAAPNVALAALTGAGNRRARVGAVRGPDLGGPAKPANIWFVDTAKGGNVCVADPKAMSLWRGDAATAGKSTVAGGGATAGVSWIAGQNSQPWPASVPISAGTSYRVGPAASEVRFTSLGTPPAELDAMASALIANNCQAQLDMLIATTAG